MTVDGYRVDLHVKVLDEAVVERAKQRGVDALVYAPHFTRLPDIREAAARFSDEDLRVFPAREIFTGTWRNRVHVLAVGLTDPVPDFVSLSGAMAEIDRQGGVALVPHPGFANVSFDRKHVVEYRDDLAAVEVYNPKLWPYQNRRAQGFAAETGLPGFASSYAHLRGTVGEAWTTFPEPVASVDELVDALEAGEFTPYHHASFTHRFRCLTEFAHLGYENTWEKLDRIFLSGTEPTHPGHVAYQGRFDDVRVY